MNFIKRAGYQAVFLGSLFYNGLGFAQETSGLSQSTTNEATANGEIKCPTCPPQPQTAPTTSTKPARVKKKSVGAAPTCSTVYPNFKCMDQTEAKVSGYEMHPARDYTTRLEEACPGKFICAGPKAEQVKDSSVSTVDEFDEFKKRFSADECRQEYVQASELYAARKEHCTRAEELEEKIAKANAKKKEIVPKTLLEAIIQNESALPQSGENVGSLATELEGEKDACSKNTEQFKEYVARLTQYGCGHKVVTIEVPKEVVKEVTVERIVERQTGGKFVFAPFMAYAFSADAENQGQLGVSAGYRTGRWTFGARAAAILQYTDVDKDTDKSGIQTVNLPGEVQKTTADITKTTTETRDFATVGPAVTYSIGRMDISAGIDALIGQKAVTKDYTGSMRLTKDGQQLDGKKTIGDSTTESEAWYSAYPHVNFDMRLWKQLYGGLEGGYNTRSDSAQGAFGLKYKF